MYLAKVAERRADSIHALYEHHLNHVILPALGELRVRECTVGRIDGFLGAMERRGYAANTRRKLRAIVSGVLQQTVLHEAISHNPVRDLERIEEPQGKRKSAAARPDRRGTSPPYWTGWTAPPPTGRCCASRRSRGPRTCRIW